MRGGREGGGKEGEAGGREGKEGGREGKQGGREGKEGGRDRVSITLIISRTIRRDRGKGGKEGNTKAGRGREQEDGKREGNKRAGRNCT